ncbi:MAG: type ISP restriction/modification enzyme [Anaerolineales bacterium]|jgi:predicted helicase|nr:type ISP restriction/modification enzyme [Anaerolineales bacterium]WKZ55842.1 MAG: N-6 DNA methylase [Anaerolineales bacterium]GER80449.1 DNA methyltransferase [Candidatus Denitrolinea symbiosum]
MTVQLIQKYYADVDKIKRYSGASNESSLRKPFQDLLEQYARTKGLALVAEVETESTRGTRIRPDGVLKDALRQDWGFWESKDEKDDIEAEIQVKFNKGYPDFNILFEDTQTAILYQGGQRIGRADFSDAAALDALLTKFVGYEPKEVSEFHKAIELFSAEVGGLAEALREVISEQLSVNSQFSGALAEFLELAKKAINPKIEMADVREMIIQHVLTEDIFMRVFDEAEFHRENVIARKLQEVAGTFYKGEMKRNIHARIAPYYETINARASQISDHHEKQKFLKALYESFYKAYNPKAADRLGIVYTPDEIVRFMIESADHLVFKHFGKTLGDKGVEILDPATGTGTFITELIEYLPPAQLEYKYENEIHCNEVSILPYYIANLNIEYTYKQRMGKFKEFENICFVDTLDNMGFEHTGKQLNFFGITDENAERIVKQNSRPIMVVIGNPPYNANQANENDNNKNREYPEIDQRIKDTYIYYSTAQKTKLYDMYTRFLRWASDRLDKDGVIAFVSNNSFLDARTYDGFRKVVGKEFNEIYIIDMKGNSHTSGERRQREGGNIFSDQIRVGVAIYFLVRKKGVKGFRIYYNAVPDYAKAEEKKAYLRGNQLGELDFQPIHPDRNNNWLNLTDNDWEDLIPIATSQTKYSKSSREINSIFEIFVPGVNTARDEWVYDFETNNLQNKIEYLIQKYNTQVRTQKSNDDDLDLSIKWSAKLKSMLLQKQTYKFNDKLIVPSLYRPYTKLFYYAERGTSDRLTSGHFEIFGKNLNQPNTLLSVKQGKRLEFAVVATNLLPNFAFYSADPAQCLPLYRYAEDGSRVENITDWALGQFQKRYKDKSISKEDIFHYVYAVLHHPAYRVKYEINLKREFPRIPFYEDFRQWADWGKRLMELHLGYETIKPYQLERIENVGAELRLRPGEEGAQGQGQGRTRRSAPTAVPTAVPTTTPTTTPTTAPTAAPITRLMARKEKGEIEIDSVTTLKGVPAEAWEYRLGTYSALEWILERYKEKKPKDPTIAEKFNTYRFAEYKEQVIDLLFRVCTVSVETMKVVKEMP